jgi:hypothetical protein
MWIWWQMYPAIGWLVKSLIMLVSLNVTIPDGN